MSKLLISNDSRRPRRFGQFALVALLGSAAVAGAGVTGVSGDSGAPPGTLGGYTLTQFPFVGGGISDVSSVASPLGGPIDFSQPMSHRVIGSGWATWSHGYTGDVYYTNGSASMSIDLVGADAGRPGDGVGAFLFYVEPNPFTLNTFTATGTGDPGQTATVTQTAHGSAGATWIGFYADEGKKLASVAIQGTTDFAIGEFSIAATPEPASLALLGLGAAAVLRRRR